MVFLYLLLVQCHHPNGKTCYPRQVYSSVQRPWVNKTLLVQFCFSALLLVFSIVVVYLISIFLSSLLLWKDKSALCNIWTCFCFQTYWRQQWVSIGWNEAFSTRKFSDLRLCRHPFREAVWFWGRKLRHCLLNHISSPVAFTVLCFTCKQIFCLWICTSWTVCRFILRIPKYRWSYLM